MSNQAATGGWPALRRAMLPSMLMGLAWCAPAWANEGAEHAAGIPEKQILFHAINLLILLAGLVYVLRPRLRDTLGNRAIEIRRALDQVNNERKEAMDRLTDIEARLSGFERQLADLKSEAELHGRAEAEAIVARAAKTAELIQATTERTIRDETIRAQQKLRHEAIGLAVKLAEERLRTSVGAADQQRLSSEFLAKVNEAPHG